ncbi:MAG: VacJ family lipoprotein [Sphingomonas sp.]
MSVSALVQALLLLASPVPAGATRLPVGAVQGTTPAVSRAGTGQSTQPLSPEPLASNGTRDGQAAHAHHHTPGDPFEGFNRRMFGLFQGLDNAVFRPAAMGYKHAVPKPLRGGLRHFLSNLGEPLVFVNYLLQFKPGKAVETLGRFVINSTLGVGGLIDVAKTRGFRLPHRPNSFGNTLAIHGVKPGPYIFLPFIGPSTLRDLIGGQGEALVYPLAIGRPFDRAAYQISQAVITGLDQRAESDDDLNALYAGAVDPYASLRSSYLQERQGEIDHIRRKSASVAVPELDELLADPAGANTGTAPGATPELADPLADPARTPPPVPSAKTTTTEPDTSDPLSDPADGKPRSKP